MIFKNWINRTFGSTGALTGSDIPYDGSNSVSEQIDDITNTRATQAEVDAGTNPNKFVTPLTLETKPLNEGLVRTIACAYFDLNTSDVTVYASSNITLVKGSTGRVSVTMPSPASDTNYLITCSCAVGTTGLPLICNVDETVGKTTSTFTLRFHNSNDVKKDADQISLKVEEIV